MRKSILSLTAALALVATPFTLGLVLSPSRAWADVTVALDGLPQVLDQVPGMIPLTSGPPPTVTLTNLRSGSTHSDQMNPDGAARIGDVPPGYYQVRITGNDRYQIDYIKVDAKGNAQLRYNWKDMYFPHVRSGQSDTEIIRGAAADVAVTTQRGFTKWQEESISNLSQVQELHRQALKRLESLGPKAIRAVGPPRFNTWRQIHQQAIRQVDTAYDQATGTPANTGSTSERRAALEEKQSQLQQQRQSQTAEIATFTPKFLERRQYLLEKLPPTLQTNLVRGGGTDPAGHAAVTRTRLQIQIEFQNAPNMDATAAADLTRLKIIYDSMAAYYTALFDTEAKIAQTAKDIAHTITDEKDYATGGGDGGGDGGNGGGN